MRAASVLSCIALAACEFTAPPAVGQVDANGSDRDANVGVDAVGGCATCPPNDVPSGAIAITGSGRIVGSLANARDDLTASCGTVGGRDLFYELIVPTTQVVYVDTVESKFDAVLSIYAGPCTAQPAQLACADDPCTGTSHAQLARSLAVGTHCLVVDEGTIGDDAHDDVTLDVVFAGRDGIELVGAGPWNVTGNTCTGSDLNDPGCEVGAGNPGSAKDLMYWFTTCPGSHTVTASTCASVGYDSIVYLRSDSGELGCRDDGCANLGTGSLLVSSSTGNGLMMVVVDGWGGACGTFSMSISQ